jgi:2-keto-4-pentenoate hydratase
MTTAGSGWKPRLCCGSETTCRWAAILSSGRSRGGNLRGRRRELIEDLRYDYTRLDAAAMVAGNVWNAGVVLGAPVTDWAVLDLAQMTACLSINVRAIGSGKGGDVMGHPLNALAWLAGKLAAVGTPLRRGMIVMTGSMVPIQYPVASDRVLVEISGLGTAELAVT